MKKALQVQVISVILHQARNYIYILFFSQEISQLMCELLNFKTKNSVQTFRDFAKIKKKKWRKKND